MTTPLERLSMLHSHIKETKPEDVQESFPYLLKTEREKWSKSDFQSTMGPSITSSITMDNIKSYVHETSIYRSSFPNNTAYTSHRPNLNGISDATNMLAETLLKVRKVFGDDEHSDSQPIISHDGLEIKIISSLLHTDDKILVIGSNRSEYLEALINISNSIDHTIDLSKNLNELLEKSQYKLIFISNEILSNSSINVEDLCKLVKRVLPDSFLVIQNNLKMVKFSQWGLDFSWLNIKTNKTIMVTSQRALTTGIESIYFSGDDESISTIRQEQYSKSLIESLNEELSNHLPSLNTYAPATYSI